MLPGTCLLCRSKTIPHGCSGQNYGYGELMARAGCVGVPCGRQPLQLEARAGPCSRAVRRPGCGPPRLHEPRPRERADRLNLVREGRRAARASGLPIRVVPSAVRHGEHRGRSSVARRRWPTGRALPWNPHTRRSAWQRLRVDRLNENIDGRIPRLFSLPAPVPGCVSWVVECPAKRAGVSSLAALWV